MPDRPAQRRRTAARRVYPLRALLSPAERHHLKVLAAQKGVSTQQLTGDALRCYYEAIGEPPAASDLDVVGPDWEDDDETES